MYRKKNCTTDTACVGRCQKSVLQEKGMKEMKTNQVCLRRIFFVKHLRWFRSSSWQLLCCFRWNTKEKLRKVFVNHKGAKNLYKHGSSNDMILWHHKILQNRSGFLGCCEQTSAAMLKLLLRVLVKVLANGRFSFDPIFSSDTSTARGDLPGGAHDHNGAERRMEQLGLGWRVDKG